MRQVVLYPDHEAGGWVAEVPSLPGCVSEGESKPEALRNARDAIRCWLDAADQLGMPVPPETCDVELCEVSTDDPESATILEK